MSNKKRLREIALDMLMQIEGNQAYSNLLLNQTIKKHGVSGKDIGLLTEIVYGTIQNKLTLDYYLQPFLKKGKKIDPWVRMLLRLSVYQMIYLDRVPERAVIHEAVEIAKKRGHKGISGMVNGVLRNLQRQGAPSTMELEDPLLRLSVETSHPLWLVESWVDQYGLKTTEKMCQVNNTPPSVTARVNTARISVEHALDMLHEEGIEAERGELAEDAIILKAGSLANSEAFKKGYLTIQDESSMLVAQALGPSEDETILDSCAAPGGKSTHVSEKMKNTGKVVSLDLHKHKVKLIADQASRLGLTNIETKAMDSRKASEQFAPESFDKILVDAPCSGFGVIRRKPDLKYVKTKSDVENLAKIQLDILKSVSGLLKKGGTLVYSTCTVDKTENEGVVKEFLSSHPEFEPDPTLAGRLPEKVRNDVTADAMVQIMPHAFGTDGFFIASFRKRV